MIPNIQAKEKLETINTVNKNNIKSLVMLAYDSPELAEKLENKFMLESMKEVKR